MYRNLSIITPFAGNIKLWMVHCIDCRVRLNAKDTQIDEHNMHDSFSSPFWLVCCTFIHLLCVPFSCFYSLIISPLYVAIHFNIMLFMIFWSLFILLILNSFIQRTIKKYLTMTFLMTWATDTFMSAEVNWHYTFMTW